MKVLFSSFKGLQLLQHNVLMRNVNLSKTPDVWWRKPETSVGRENYVCWQLIWACVNNQEEKRFSPKLNHNVKLWRLHRRLELRQAGLEPVEHRESVVLDQHVQQAEPERQKLNHYLVRFLNLSQLLALCLKEKFLGATRSSTAECTNQVASFCSY